VPRMRQISWRNDCKVARARARDGALASRRLARRRLAADPARRQTFAGNRGGATPEVRSKGRADISCHLQVSVLILTPSVVISRCRS